MYAAFHKALYRYPSRDTDEVDVVKVYVCRKLLKYIWFDKIIAKINWCSFLTHSVVYQPMRRPNIVQSLIDFRCTTSVQ